jgi:flagellar basal-body rod protein FlgF
VSINQNSAVIGLFRQQRRYELIANNLSNLQTPGFKKDAIVFHRVFSDALNPSLAALSSDTEISQTLFNQGEVHRTGNLLDLAVEGEGFFKIKTPAGVRYTRNGNFHLTPEGVLVQSNGFPVLGKDGEITLRGSKIEVEKDGTIKVDGENQNQIALVTFADLKGLRKEGQSLFRLDTEQEEKASGEGRVLQGVQEGSNVNSMDEMVQLIDALRSFETCHKIVQVQDEMNARAVNDLAKV